MCCFIAVLVLLGIDGFHVKAEEAISFGINWMESKDEGILPPAVEVPILMYHNLVEDEQDPSISRDTIWVGDFQRHMDLLQEHGFQTVSFDQLIALAYRGEALPENPVLITFDDGYESVYDLAFPILKELNMQAAVFPIGVSVGKDTYKDTNLPITPHFTWEQAKEMVDSGLISVQSHTYDMHQVSSYEIAAGGTFLRPNILQQPWETKEEYAKALLDDLNLSRNEIEKFTQQKVTVLAYPGGIYDALSEKLLASYGIQCTLTTQSGKAEIQPWSPNSLYALKRFYVSGFTTDEELLNWVS